MSPKEPPTCNIDAKLLRPSPVRVNSEIPSASFTILFLLYVKLRLVVHLKLSFLIASNDTNASTP